jgi:hypothetical protein
MYATVSVAVDTITAFWFTHSLFSWNFTPAVKVRLAPAVLEVLLRIYTEKN